MSVPAAGVLTFQREGGLPNWVRGALIALPFVFPMASGPSADVWQLLASWTCVALLLLAGPVGLPRVALVAWLMVGALGIALSPSSEARVWVPACLAVFVMAAAACVGAGSGAKRGASSDGNAGPAGAPNATPGASDAIGAIAWGLFIAGLISAVLGLLQYYGLAGWLSPWTTSPAAGQAYGNLRQRNQFATLVSMALIASLWLHAGGGSRFRRFFPASCGLLIIAAAASTSRTGLLQLIAIASVAALLAYRERCPSQRSRGAHAGRPAPRLPSPWTIAAAVPFYFAASWLVPWLAPSGVDNMLDRLREGAPDAHSRVLLWRNVVDLIGIKPWRGWGWGELKFAHFDTLYDGPRFSEILDNAHNLPLHLAVELGLPFAIVICIGFAWLVLSARPWRETDAARLMAWGLLAVIVLHSLLEYPLWYGPFQLVFGLCLGILWPARRVGVARRASLHASVAALALMAAVVHAGWEYTRVSQLFIPRDQRFAAWKDDSFAKMRDAWLFDGQVEFAELSLTPVTRTNAQAVHRLALDVLHFSPEPRVVSKLIDSAMLTGRDDEALAIARRFKIAFPREYARWRDNQPLDGTANAK